MDTVDFARWRIEYDPVATRVAHQAIECGSPEKCGCVHCCNFVACRPELYPQPMLSLFERLGVHSSHESEVYHTARLADGLHEYGGWLHCVGRLVAGIDSQRQLGEST